MTLEGFLKTIAKIHLKVSWNLLINCTFGGSKLIVVWIEETHGHLQDLDTRYDRNHLAEIHPLPRWKIEQTAAGNSWNSDLSLAILYIDLYIANTGFFCLHVT